MADRLLEIVAPRALTDVIRDALGSSDVLDAWYEDGHDERVLVRALVLAHSAESVVDKLESRLAGGGVFHIVMLPIEAVVPRPVEPDEAAEKQAGEPAERPAKPARIGREELWADIAPAARLTTTHLVLVVLSTVVAAVGFHRDSATIVIAAMLMAPLLGPNIALALATTLGDLKLGFRALRVNIVGLTTALALAVLVGVALPIDPSDSEVHSRTQVGGGDVALALAAGVAGTLAFTTGAPASLVGVMVAVALLPPLVVVGMLLGVGEWLDSLRAALLVVVNVICVNLAAVATFLAQGVRPRTWWETGKAKRATRIAMTLWVTLLAILAALIVIAARDHTSAG